LGNSELLVIVCGVCGSGKSTLVAGLKKAGYHVHSVAQEHSYSPTMYTMTTPDFVITLDCDLEHVLRRRQVQWGEDRLKVQRARLSHVREHCNLFIDTSELSREDVLTQAIIALESYTRV
jgi:RNase adaptor protein for sRNA GlmZ degradation